MDATTTPLVALHKNAVFEYDGRQYRFHSFSHKDGSALCEPLPGPREAKVKRVDWPKFDLRTRVRIPS